MTPQSCCRSTVLLLYTGLAVSASLLVAAEVAWLAAGMHPGSWWVFLLVFAVLCCAAVWPGAWLLAEVDRQWELLKVRDGE